MRPNGRAALLVKLSAEKRALDPQVVDLLAKVNPALATAVVNDGRILTRFRRVGCRQLISFRLPLTSPT
jgi:hypothetical protein